MPTALSNKLFRIRSFVRRVRRITPAQGHAIQTGFPSFGLKIEDGTLDCKKIFGRLAPLFLEIGFGNGESLLALALANPDKDFIGVETHQPGTGALLMGIKKNNLTNLRVFASDVIDVCEVSVPDACLSGVQIFFPDPWPKRRHHPRRLVQTSFIALLISKLKIGGSLHLATDCEDYAKHMMQVLTHEDRLINLAGMSQFATRSPYRPIITKFERRGKVSGRTIWDLQFERGK
jgi:tRNA (guanine-N7-)-methyltransferase